MLGHHIAKIPCLLFYPQQVTRIALSQHWSKKLKGNVSYVPCKEDQTEEVGFKQVGQGLIPPSLTYEVLALDKCSVTNFFQCKHVMLFAFRNQIWPSNRFDGYTSSLTWLRIPRPTVFFRNPTAIKISQFLLGSPLNG